MAKNLKLFFDSDGSPRARGPSSEKLLMAFLEADVQGSDHICHNIMDDITAIEDESAESREFYGNAHSVVITADGVTIECTIDDVNEANAGDNAKTATPASKSDHPETTKSSQTAADTAESGADAPTQYKTGLKHFREVLEDWEAFILDDQSLT